MLVYRQLIIHSLAAFGTRQYKLQPPLGNLGTYLLALIPSLFFGIPLEAQALRDNPTSLQTQTVQYEPIIFDGTALTEERARSIASAEAHQYIGMSACKGGDSATLPNCVNLEVKTANNAHRIFGLLGLRCREVQFQTERGQRVRISSLQRLLSDDVVIVPGPRCYGDYVAFMRNTLTISTDAQANRASSHILLQVDRPIAAGPRPWAHVGTFEMANMSRLQDRFPPRHTWSVSVVDAEGTVEFNDSSDDGQRSVNADSGSRNTRRAQSENVSPQQLCKAKQESVTASMELSAQTLYSACALNTTFTDQIEIQIGTGSAPGGNVRVTGDGVCDVARDQGLALAKAVAAMTYSACLEKAAATPPAPPNPPGGPTEPTEPPVGDEPPDPICPEVSNVPYSQGFSYFTPGQAGQPGTEWYCENVVQDTCTANEELGICECEQNLIEEGECVGIQELGGSWEFGAN